MVLRSGADARTTVTVTILGRHEVRGSYFLTFGHPTLGKWITIRTWVPPKA
jgi:hypothetical protein